MTRITLLVLFFITTLGHMAKPQTASNTRFYQSQHNQCIAFGSEKGDNAVYFSNDCVRFQKLVGGSSTPEDATKTVKQYFRIPGEEEVELVWYYAYDHSKITLNGLEFVPTKVVGQKIFLDYPVIRIGMLLARTAENEYVYISSEKYRQPHTTIRLYIGQLNSLKRIEGATFEANSCGAYWVRTKLGVFAYHTPDAAKKPSWKGKKIVLMDLRRFAINEQDNNTSITLIN